MFQAIMKTGRRFAQADMADLHQEVYKAAGSGTVDTAPRDFVFRDYDCSEGTGVILRTSKEVRPPQGWSVTRIVPFQPVRAPGEELDFNIRVNAIRNIPNPVFKGSKRLRGLKRSVYGLYIEGLKAQNPEHWPSREEILDQSVGDWFRGIAPTKGFEVSELYVENGPFFDFYKPDGSRVKFDVYDISGRLQVTNPEVFAETLTKGIGSKKAYGCGLLLVR